MQYVLGTPWDPLPILAHLSHQGSLCDLPARFQPADASDIRLVESSLRNTDSKPRGAHTLPCGASLRLGAFRRSGLSPRLSPGSDISARLAIEKNGRRSRLSHENYTENMKNTLAYLTKDPPISVTQ
ncbi:hypothetical protein EVAR_90196_1 [Eumeta japonica]|uniref:Uncharacterized protein n=1 Tax=Eumeta variegata TaxID=151549 RepID=A0A4C1WYM3_EUMVA|nr:hypothetical protein EVAR_90196_1 [Eumeta japonica]